MCAFLLLSFPILFSPVLMSCSETELFTTAAAAAAAAALRTSSAVSDTQKTVSWFVSHNAHLKYLCICSLALLGQVRGGLELLYFCQNSSLNQMILPPFSTYFSPFHCFFTLCRNTVCEDVFSLAWPDWCGILGPNLPTNSTNVLLLAYVTRLCFTLGMQYS